MTARGGLAVLATAASLLAGCGRGAGATSSELTVFAAASLGPVLADLAPAYAAVEPGVALIVSTDSSAALATQIEHGAPAEVLLSADTTNADRLVAAGVAEGEPIPFARNTLAVIVPEGNPAGIVGPAALGREGVKVIAAGYDVPVSAYAARLIDNLARLPGYPTGFARAYAANVVSREDSVAGVVAKIELGEGDAGIVYATDAAASGDVETIPIPAEVNVVATYAAVVVGGRDARAAGAFVEWLVGPDGQSILAAHGFIPVA